MEKTNDDLKITRSTQPGTSGILQDPEVGINAETAHEGEYGTKRDLVRSLPY